MPKPTIIKAQIYPRQKNLQTKIPTPMPIINIASKNLLTLQNFTKPPQYEFMQKILIS